MTIDPIDLVRAEELLLGYTARWFDEPYEVLAVEQEFEAPLVNPDTGFASKTFALAGVLDVVLRHIPTSRVLVMDHKSSSEEIAIGSTYWKRLLLNTQVNQYLVGARALGFDTPFFLFDLIGKPGIRPLKATPVESRKYKKTGELYANQREVDETADEYRIRLREAIAAEPDRYYVRGEVVRLLEEEREAAFDVWQTAANIREGRQARRFPRNPDACVRYGGVCDFFPVCTGEAVLEASMHFRRVENAHQELDAKRAHRLPVLTNSELGTFRACARLHHNRYDLGYLPRVTSEAKAFGTLLHRGLEGWWLAKRDGADVETTFRRALEHLRHEPEPVQTFAVQEPAPPAQQERIVL